MKIATMGIDFLDKSNFKTDGEISLNKPRFGLYGSTIIKNGSCRSTSWLDFCYSNEFHTDKYSKGIQYTLYKKTKIYTLDSLDDYLNLLKKYSVRRHLYGTRYEICIDWNKFKEDYDAFHLTLNAFWELRMLFLEDKDDNSKIADFYSYDCETWIIFNFDCINLGSVSNISISEIEYDNFYKYQYEER